MTLQQMQDKILSDRRLALDDTYIPRSFTYPEILGMASVIVGARRVGKSCFLRLKAKELVLKGTPEDKICYLSFFGIEDEKIPFSLVEKAYYSLYPNYSKDPEVHFFLDEIQNIDFWGEGISNIMDVHKCKVTVSGSSAKYLSTDIASELRGRSISYRFYPLSFEEFARFTGESISASKAYSNQEQNQLRYLFKQYMEKGSYPALASIDNAETRKQMLITYFDLAYSMDIIDRFDVTKGSMLKKLMRRMVKNSGSPYTIRRLEHYLASEGYRTSTAIISDYLDMMTDTCFFTDVRVLGNSKKENSNPRKLYTIDHSMAALFREFGQDSGKRLEHAVLGSILRCTPSVCYYRTAADKELDFVVTDSDKNPRTIIQVTDDSEASMQREIQSTEEGMKELGFKEAYLVTSDEEKDINVESGTIHAIPGWRFMLNAASIIG